MKKPILIIILFGLFTNQFAFSQTKIYFGTELGINSSGLPESYYKIGYNYWNSYNSTTNPVLSPVFGMWVNVNFKKHFIINLGAQHYQVGYYYENHTTNIDKLFPGETFNNDEWRHLLMQKLAIPLSVGYEFNIRKMKVGLFAGFSKNYMINAGYYDNEIMIKDYSPIENYIEEHYSFPFEKTQYSSYAQRWSKNKFIGISAYVSKKINLSFSYSSMEHFYFGNIYSPYEYKGNFYPFEARDYKMSVKYCFN